MVICVTGGESRHHQLQERTWGRVEDDFREVPCGFSRHLLPLTNPLHHGLNPHPHPHLPSRSPVWQTGSLPASDDKWMAGMPGPGGVIGVWPRGSAGLHTPSGSGGLTLDHDTCRTTQNRGCADGLGLWCGSICSLDGVIVHHLADELILEILALIISMGFILGINNFELNKERRTSATGA